MKGQKQTFSRILSAAMVFSVVSAPQTVSAATDTSGHWAEAKH